MVLYLIVFRVQLCTTTKDYKAKKVFFLQILNDDSGTFSPSVVHSSTGPVFWAVSFNCINLRNALEFSMHNFVHTIIQMFKKIPRIF